MGGMVVTLSKLFEPEVPLQDFPQLVNGRVYFAYQRELEGEEEDRIELGVCAYEFESRQTELIRAPFVVEDEDGSAEWRLLAARKGRLVLRLKWESSYECNYRFFEFDVAGGKWSEYGDYDEMGEIELGDDGPWVSPENELDLETATLSGGDIHFWIDDDETLHIIADCTHAFDRDSSDASMTEPAYEQAKEEHPLVRTNFDYSKLARYINYNSDMYQQAVKDGTPNLPDAIPPDHPVRTIDNLHDFGVGRVGSHLLFVQNDFRAGGIVGILHLIED